MMHTRNILTTAPRYHRTRNVGSYISTCVILSLEFRGGFFAINDGTGSNLTNDDGYDISSLPTNNYATFLPSLSLDKSGRMRWRHTTLDPMPPSHLNPSACAVLHWLLLVSLPVMIVPVRTVAPDSSLQVPDLSPPVEHALPCSRTSACMSSS